MEDATSLFSAAYGIFPFGRSGTLNVFKLINSSCVRSVSLFTLIYQLCFPSSYSLLCFSIILRLWLKTLRLRIYKYQYCTKMSSKMLCFNIISSSNHKYCLLAYLFFGMVGLVKVGFEAIEIFNMVCRLSKVGPEKN